MGALSEDAPEARASLSSPTLLVLVEKIPAVLWTTNPDLRLTSLAGAGLAAMNIRPEDYVGMCLNDFLLFHGPDAPPLVAHRRAMRGEAFAFDIEMAGREFEAHVEPLRGPKGDIVGVIGVALDDTERRVAERSLRLSEESYRSLIEEAPYGICRATVSGEFLQVNRAMAEMLGYESEQELLVRSLRRDIFIEPDQYDRFHVQLQDKNSCQGFECAWRPRQGKTILVSLGGRAVRDVTGESSYLEIVAENVTERKQLEDQLRQAQKMQAVGQLAGGVAHDFNNLLTVIKGQVEMVMAEMVPGDPLRSRLKEAELATDRAAALTGQLLAFSRRQVLQSKVLDLNAIISGMTQLLARLIGENIQLTFAPGADLGTVNADPAQIEQVLLNLVVNARDAMPDGGRLQIETHNADLDVNHEHTVVEPGQYVEFVVSDTGHGMDAETRARIFEPFFTTKEPGRGTGLGLSMAYGVVKQSGGYIWAYSEPGKGASFKIYLPRVARTVEANAIAQELPSPSGHETILFAEDEGSVRQLVSAFLESRGYRVLVAADGASARQAAHAHKDKIDLLLSDVVMPKIGGRELAEDLRRTIPSLKVLFLSGYAGGPALHPSVQESGTAYVQKPFSMRFLARKVREVLDGPSASLVHPKADAAATM